MKASLGILAAALLAAVSWAAAPAAAAPISSSMGLQNSLESPIQTVRGRYRGYRGFGAGFATGLILGGAPYYYGYPYPYGYGPYSYPYSYPYAYRYPYAGGDAIAYCMQRFRSYDPGSRTYLGFDGLRHPCP